MSRFRALIFDIDGTLVPPGGRPHGATVAAITACRAAGVACFVATARRPASAVVALGPLAWLAESGVFHAGALARCKQSGFRAATEISAGLVGGIVALAEASESSPTIGIHTADGQASFGPTIPPEAMLREWGCTTAELVPFAQARAAAACKLAVWSEQGPLHALAEEIAGRWPGAVAAMPLDGGRFINITAAGSDKATLLAPLLASHGLTLAQSVAFGDDLSDVPLLRAAGHAVGIADGHAEALAVADEIAAGPHHDGIARALARLFPDLRW